MTDKKDPGKFTIRFNICDPQHKAVIDLLNRQGRSKAQFLVSAVLHYINCKETPEVSVPVPNQAALEEIILAILAKNQSYLKKQPEPKPSTAQQDAATCKYQYVLNVHVLDVVTPSAETAVTVTVYKSFGCAATVGV